jgi:hypothetical protein
MVKSWYFISTVRSKTAVAPGPGAENFISSKLISRRAEEEDEEEDLFLVNDTVEGPRAPAVKPAADSTVGHLADSFQGLPDAMPTQSGNSFQSPQKTGKS